MGQRSIGGSLCSVVYHGQKQTGFARVITDEASFAYLCDVFIDDEHRGQGLSKWLMEIVWITDPARLAAVYVGHKRYTRIVSIIGFASLTLTDRWMDITNRMFTKAHSGRKANVADTPALVRTIVLQAISQYPNITISAVAR